MKPMIKQVEFGPQKFVMNYRLPFSHLFQEGELFCTSSWINVNSVKYVPKKCLLAVGYSEENEPKFAALKVILKYSEGPIFVCKKVRTISIDKNLMAYEIYIENDYKIFRPSDLQNHEVFHSHRFKNKSFVIVKRCFGDLY